MPEPSGACSTVAGRDDRSHDRFNAVKIAYFVHDVNDAAVARRVAMLQASGGEPVLIGFRRRDDITEQVGGAPVVDLGKTRDAQMSQRALAVLWALVAPGKILAASAGAEVVIGRNLESLALAARVRRAAPKAALVYECLDIHRLMLRQDGIGRAPFRRSRRRC